MNGAAFLDELVARMELTEGSGSLLFLIVPSAVKPEDAAARIARALQSRGIDVEALRFGARHGPAEWVNAAAGSAAKVVLTWLDPTGELVIRADAKVFNAQRELLHELRRPLLLVLGEDSAAILQRDAPDFCTWAAWRYLVPLDDLPEGPAPAGASPSVVAAPTPPIRFLHLSDLHLRDGKVRRYDQDKVLDGLLRTLEARRPPDIIFLTGDLAFSGKAAEYEIVGRWLRALLDATGVAPERLFVVPGNHDVDRRVGRWLLRTLTSSEQSTEFFVEETNRAQHLRKFDAFAEAIRGVAGQQRPIGLRTGEDAVEIVDVRGARLAVASFNSAWFAVDDEDRGQLWLGEANVQAAARRAREDDVSLSIALLHHPTDLLADAERSYVENHLERAFDIVLRGHLHRDKVRAGVTARGGYLEIAAAAGYQGSQWPAGCFMGEIDVARRTVRLGAFTFGESADPWVPDARVFPDDANDDYHHTFHLPTRALSTSRRWVEKLSSEVTRAYLELDSSERANLTGSARFLTAVDHAAPWRELQRQGRVVEQWDALGRAGSRRVLRSRVAEMGHSLVALVPKPEVSLRDAPARTLVERFVEFWRAEGDRWKGELGDPELAFEIAFFAFAERCDVILPREFRISFENVRPGEGIDFSRLASRIGSSPRPILKGSIIAAVVSRDARWSPAAERVRFEEYPPETGRIFLIWG